MSAPVDDVGVVTGLSSAEVAARVAAGRVNTPDDTSSRSLGQIVRGNLFTLFNAILGAALVVVLAVGAWRDAVFGLVLVSNTLVGAVTEYRAKRTLDRLSILHQAQVTAVRDGTDVPVGSSEVVADDVLRLRLGDQVPADGEVLATAGLEVDESMLTGESEPVAKATGDAVLSGSAVVAGSATVRVTAVGAASYAQRVTAEAKRFSLVGSELRSGINRVLVVVSWVIVPIALLLFWSQVRDAGGFRVAFAGEEWRDAAVQAIAGIVGMVPEGLVLLTSINFALAAVILARRQVLVNELPAVEVLARVDVLCLDKTGTLTDGTVVLDRLDTLDDVAGAREVLAAIARAEDASPTTAAVAAGLEDAAPAEMEVVVPFSSARKWSRHRTRAGDWVLGAPEVLLAGRDDDLTARVAELAGGGARLLLLAAVDAGALGEELPAEVRPALLAVLRENVRPDAAETLRYFAAQGVDVKVISGDNPATVASIATSVGLGGGAEVVGVDARTLPQDREGLRDAVARGQVFGRVTPEQKRAMVHALQDDGRTAAMTGDGVNDALALKDADLGIAMGSGAAATRAVARVVLLDGRFATLPGVVAQGRRVIANMERVAALFLTKTTYAVLLAVVVAVVAWPYPFLPRHLTLVGALTIGTPAFFLALAPNDERYRRGFLDRVLRLAVPCGLICGTGVLVVFGVLLTGGQDVQARTGATLVLIVMALWLLGILARPWSWWRVGLVGAMALGAVLALVVPFVREFFALEVPTGQTWTLVLVVGAVGAALIEVVHRLRGRTQAPEAPAVPAPSEESAPDRAAAAAVLAGETPSGPGSRPEAQSEQEPEPMTGPAAEPEPAEAEPGSESKPEPETKTKTEPVAESHPEPEPATESLSEPAAEQDPEPVAEPDHETGPELEVSAEPEPQTESHGATESEPEPIAASKRTSAAATAAPRRTTAVADRTPTPRRKPATKKPSTAESAASGVTDDPAPKPKPRPRRPPAAKKPATGASAETASGAASAADDVVPEPKPTPRRKPAAKKPTPTKPAAKKPAPAKPAPPPDDQSGRPTTS